MDKSINDQTQQLHEVMSIHNLFWIHLCNFVQYHWRHQQMTNLSIMTKSEVMTGLDRLKSGGVKTGQT